MRSRRGRIALLAICLVLGISVSAWSHWEASSTAGGNGAAVAATVNQGATPSATAAGAQGVTIAWAASLLSDGQAVTGYRIRRYDAGTNVLQTILASCTGVVSATTCRENSVPAGSWRYTVTPVIGTNWQGAESLKSGAVTSVTSTLALSQNLFGLPLPKTVTGTLAGFGASEGVTYRLDGATALTGSPSSVGAGGSAAITSLTIPSVADGAHTVHVDGSDGSHASVGIVIDTTAPAASATPTPTPNGAGWNSTTPVSVALSANDGSGSGIANVKYTTDGSDPTISGTALVYSTALSIAATTTIKYFATDAAGNASAVQTQLVKIDAVAPANAITLSGITGGASKSGSTVYYRGTAVGSFTLTNTVADGSSGAASSATAALTGPSAGWTHTPSVVSTPAGGPYVSNGFSWSALTTSSPGEIVTGSDVAGKTAATALTFTDDSTGPAGGAVDATGLVGTGSRYATSTSLSIARAAVTDAGAGVATGASLWRASASLAGGVCGGYTAYTTQIGAADPTFPVADTVAAGSCYRYESRILDLVGNQSTQQSGDIKVDTSAPTAPTFAFSAFSNTYWSGAGSTVYYRANAASGSFTATATGVDAVSGIASYALPTLGANWTAPSGGTGVQTYAWSAPPAAPAGAQNATATNNASLTSSAGGFTMVSDITAPTAGTLTYANGYATGASVSVAFAAGTDGGSGIATSSGVIQRAAAPLSSAGACGTYGSFSAIAGGTNPTTPLVDSGVAAGNCYQYRYLLSDNVGNQVITTSASVAKIDYAQAVRATSGLVGQWRLGEATMSTDSFTGSAGTVLASHTGELGATWTNWGATYSLTTGLALSTENRIRKTGTGFNYFVASAVPASADFGVEADLHVKSLVANDRAGVVGRFDSTYAAEDWYEASYDSSAGQWRLRKSVDQILTTIGLGASQTLSVGQSYRLRLEMIGSSVKLYVDGVLKISATDTTITGAGKAGVFSGSGAAASVTDTTGLHLDNFNVTPPMRDSSVAALNTGGYFDGPTLSAAGALNGDSDTAATFGSTTNGSVPDSASLDVGDTFTLEAWVKRADSATPMKTIANKGAGSFHWGFLNNRMTLQSDGGAIIAQTTTTQTDALYHHYVATKSAGTVKLYVDGIDVTGTVTNATLTNTATDLYFGAKDGATLPLNGTMDEAAIYNVALSAATVQAHYALAGGADVAGPTGGSVDATGLVGTGSRYSTSTALSIALVKGSDPAGVAATGAQLRRSTATLTNGSCGSYDVSVQVGGNDPTTPVANTVPAGQACYRYEYVVADTLGNLTTYLSGDIKVDATAPAAPTFAFSALTNAYWTGSGSTVYYRPAATSGSFTATATAVDADAGIATYSMPNLGTGWTVPAGTTGVQSYAWTAPNPAVPSGAQNATATNNATLTSTAGFTVVGDNSAPAGGSVSYTDGMYASPSVPVTFTTGTDGGSGLNATSGVLQRASATLTGSTCGGYGSFTTVAGGTNPSTPFTDSTVLRGNCYQYRYLFSDNVGNAQTYTNANVAKIANYTSTVTSTSGLVNYWRLGEDPPIASDTFTGAATTLLSSHNGELGATWTEFGSQYGLTTTLVLTNQNRLRKSGSGFNYYPASATPASADYAVEADVHVKSLVANDRAGVVGRYNSAYVSEDWYEASYDASNGAWALAKSVDEALSPVGSSAAQTLMAGSTYRLRLELAGTAIKLYVDGVLKISATDSSVTAAGKGGVFSGNSGSASTLSDTTGLQLDEFRVLPPTTTMTATDGQGTANGSYNGTSMSLSRDSGALIGDANTALSFDGVDDYVSAARQIGDDFSLEYWFKSTQGIGTGALWTNGAGMVDNDVAGTNNDFGTSLRSDGKVVAGVGGGAGGDTSVVSTTAGFNNGVWHHVVFTRLKSSGVFKLYVDGNLEGTATSSNVATLNAVANLNFGRLASGGASYFRGSLDEVATYNVVLTPAQVSAHYAAR